MCGIVGYIGKEQNVMMGIQALKRLEYRGYDSAGICWYCAKKKEIFYVKKAGKIENLERAILKSNFELFGNLFIAQTRWATHGEPNEANAHPHFDCKKEIFLVHNGIIENYRELKEKLIKEGHKFSSDTDTEVLCHLIEKYFEGNLEKALEKALCKVRGTYGILVISKKDPEKIVAARVSSPLLLGVGQKEYVLASDATAILPYTKKVIPLDDFEMAVVKKDGFFILKEKKVLSKKVWEIDWTLEEAQKGGYSHFMLKEIMEIPQAVENAILGRTIEKEGLAKLGGLEQVQERLKEIEKFYLIGCGTSFHAAKVGEIMLEEYAQVEAKAELASEIKYRQLFLDPKKVAAIFISQSGETADTLGALREFKRKGILCLGITNVVGSSQARETDAGVYTRSGPEISVASTKAFLGQLSVLVLITVFLGRQRKMSYVMGKRILQQLKKIPQLSKKVLKKSLEIKKLAKKYKNFKNFLFLARKYNFPIALEGALKLKEIAYLHAEGLAGGELKHGPLALIDKNVLTVAICPKDSVYEKMISNLQEIKARGGKILAISTQGNKEIQKVADNTIFIPKTLEMLTPMLSVLPLYLFSYHLATILKKDPDYPRCLAKSVTVE